MATTYKSTIQINVWKEHSCIHCGSRFRYLFKREITGEGRTPDAASKAAHQAAANSLENDVDVHPCPGCGLYQPDMIGSRRASRHGWLTLATAVVLIVLWILLLCDVLTSGLTALIAAGSCAFLGLIHWMIDSGNPNRYLDTNKQLAQQQVENGALWMVPDSSARFEGDAPVFGWSSAHLIAYILFGLGLLALVSAEGLRMMHGWATNSAWYPQVAGPGDDPYIYFPNKITSVKGYWQGVPKVEVLNSNELGQALSALSATSKNDQWGEQIQIGSKESKTSTNTLWLRVKLPNDPRLEGKTLKLKMQMEVTYPQLAGDKWFPMQEQFERQAEIRLGGAEAGSRYKQWFWAGYIGGAVLVIASGLWLMALARGLRNLAQPTSIFTLGEPEPAQDDIPGGVPPDQPHREGDGDIIQRDS